MLDIKADCDWALIEGTPLRQEDFDCRLSYRVTYHMALDDMQLVRYET